MNLRQLLERSNRPFPPHPQVSRYFPAASTEGARVRLARSIERGDGPGIVIGAAGSGKSLLLQVLAAQYRERFDVVLLACAQVCTRRALLQAIHFELGLDYRQRDEGQLRLSLLDQLLSASEAVEGLLLLVDEAQALSTPLLEELRVLTNLACNGVSRVRLVLAGSPALEERLASPELESFSQRLAARTYLSPFSREETGQYGRAQLAASGVTTEQIFATSAWDPLFSATDGVPRLVNQLCDRALLLADAQRREQVDGATIQAAWADLQQLPTAWEPAQKAAPQASASAGVVEFGSLDAIQDVPTIKKEPSPCPLSQGEGLRSAANTFAQISDWDARLPDDDDVDPTDLDDETASAPVTPAKPAVAEPPKRPAPSYRRRIVGERVPEATDPFGDEFDEEELVLDNFAALAGMFRNETPRVENRRDPAFSRLVQRALDSSTMVEAEPRRREAGEASKNAVTELERPQIRLAVVADTGDVEQSSSEHGCQPPARDADAVLDELDRLIAAQDEARAKLQRSTPSTWPITRTMEALAPAGASTALEIEAPAAKVAAMHDDLTASILVIEDEPAEIVQAEPGVRREEYRQLFSRLRHG